MHLKHRREWEVLFSEQLEPNPSISAHINVVGRQQKVRHILHRRYAGTVLPRQCGEQTCRALCSLRQHAETRVPSPHPILLILACPLFPSLFFPAPLSFHKGVCVTLASTRSFTPEGVAAMPVSANTAYSAQSEDRARGRLSALPLCAPLPAVASAPGAATSGQLSSSWNPEMKDCQSCRNATHAFHTQSPAMKVWKSCMFQFST